MELQSLFASRPVLDLRLPFPRLNERLCSRIELFHSDLLEGVKSPDPGPPLLPEEPEQRAGRVPPPSSPFPHPARVLAGGKAARVLDERKQPFLFKRLASLAEVAIFLPSGGIPCDAVLVGSFQKESSF